MDAALPQAEQPQSQAAQAGTHIPVILTISATTGAIQYPQLIAPELLPARSTMCIPAPTLQDGIAQQVIGLKSLKY